MRPQASSLTEKGQKKEKKGSEFESGNDKENTGSESCDTNETVEGACKEFPKWRPTPQGDKNKAKKTSFCKERKPFCEHAS